MVLADCMKRLRNYSKISVLKAKSDTESFCENYYLIKFSKYQESLVGVHNENVFCVAYIDLPITSEGKIKINKISSRSISSIIKSKTKSKRRIPIVNCLIYSSILSL